VLEQIHQAIESQDFSRASLLLEQLQQQQPDHPWLNFYSARLHELKGTLVEAEQLYKKILQTTEHGKIIAQARQGLQRLQELEIITRQTAIANAKAKSGGEEFGILILEAIEPENRATAAKAFAQIMQIDPYSARLQLPARSWRLYRSGAIGELEFYVTSLRAANISCFCTSLLELSQIAVQQIDYFQAIEPQISLKSEGSEPTEMLTFTWQEVTQKVAGLIPLFEEVVDTNRKGQTYRKTQILDYVKILDLHLPKQKTILRLCDRIYQFNRGVNLSTSIELMSATEQTTASKNWHHLQQAIEQYLPKCKIWSEFTVFAESAINFPEILNQIEPQFKLLRRQESLWDNAFELYSRLIFVKDEY
jgi:hypothetical protein